MHLYIYYIAKSRNIRAKIRFRIILNTERFITYILFFHFFFWNGNIFGTL